MVNPITILRRSCMGSEILTRGQGVYRIMRKVHALNTKANPKHTRRDNSLVANSSS